MNEKKQWEAGELIDLMIEKHVISIKMGSLEITMHPSAFTAAEELDTKTPLNEEPTEDEMLYASSPYFDVLRAQRKEAK